MSQVQSISDSDAFGDRTGYLEWMKRALESDRRTKAADWREDDFSEYYDFASIRSRTEKLRASRLAQDDRELLFALNEGIHGNMDGIANPKLWSKAKFGTKSLIHAYVDEIAVSLLRIASPEAKEITESEKVDFFNRASHCFGSSALLLSGAGSLMYFHAGVMRALLQEKILPSIISGSSGGAFIGSVVCTHSDEELDSLLEAGAFATPDSDGSSGWLAILGLGKVASQDEVWRSICSVIPDLTFQEAFERSGRYLNISVAAAEKHQNGRLLNALTSPNVTVREAVLASCAVPGFFASVQLMAKDHSGQRVPYLAERKWVDGSVTHDLPRKRLSRLYGVNHHIVSQAHPLIAPLSNQRGMLGSYVGMVQKAGLTTAKAWLNAAMDLLDKPLSLVPPVHNLVGTVMAIANQDYVGDINIVRPNMYWLSLKIVSMIDTDEMAELIRLGEEAAWPKIEMVRLQTKISRTLNEINRKRSASKPSSVKVAG